MRSSVMCSSHLVFVTTSGRRRATCRAELCSTLTSPALFTQHNIASPFLDVYPDTIRARVTMSADLIQPPANITPATALRLSQQAPATLSKTSSLASLPYPLSLLTSTETQETWLSLENLLISTLRTGDDKAARQCLNRLTQRFGESNERVMALQGMFEEAVADDEKALQRVLKEYDALLHDEDPTNIPIRKRKVALLRSTGKIDQAVQALVELLDSSPTDAEAWSELSDIYFTQGSYDKAIYALEEVILCVPNAWNMQARLGEVLYVAATSGDSPDRSAVSRGVSDALRRFCRSIELCDNYLRGYYGLKIASRKLLETLPQGGRSAVATTEDDLPPPDRSTVERLNQLATSKLAEIVRKSSSGERGWEGYDQAELIAARALLNQDEEKITR